MEQVLRSAQQETESCAPTDARWFPVGWQCTPCAVTCKAQPTLGLMLRQPELPTRPGPQWASCPLPLSLDSQQKLAVGFTQIRWGVQGGGVGASAGVGEMGRRGRVCGGSPALPQVG